MAQGMSSAAIGIDHCLANSQSRHSLIIRLRRHVRVGGRFKTIENTFDSCDCFQPFDQIASSLLRHNRDDVQASRVTKELASCSFAS